MERDKLPEKRIEDKVAEAFGFVMAIIEATEVRVFDENDLLVLNALRYGYFRLEEDDTLGEGYMRIFFGEFGNKECLLFTDGQDYDVNLFFSSDNARHIASLSVRQYTDSDSQYWEFEIAEMGSLVIPQPPDDESFEGKTHPMIPQSPSFPGRKSGDDSNLEVSTEITTHVNYRVLRASRGLKVYISQKPIAFGEPLNPVRANYLEDEYFVYTRLD